MFVDTISRVRFNSHEIFRPVKYVIFDWIILTFETVIGIALRMSLAFCAYIHTGRYDEMVYDAQDTRPYFISLISHDYNII